MIILDGIKNLLVFLNSHWAEIVAIIGLGIGLYKKAKEFMAVSNEDKIKLAKEQIKLNMLKYVTEAEKDYFTWVKAGEIKRSDVIHRIYEEYPILSKVIDQKELIVWIDKTINEALVTLREIIAENNVNNE